MTPNEELRKLAEAATPGEWYDNPKNAERDDKSVLRWSGSAVAITAADEDAAFIAAANPARVLALLDEIEALKSEVERLRKELKAFSGAALSVSNMDPNEIIHITTEQGKVLAMVKTGDFQKLGAINEKSPPSG